MPPEHAREGIYGETVLAADPRFSFAWRAAPSGQAGRPLLICVHGSDRNWLQARDAFSPLADRFDLALLSPLFPAGIAIPAMGDGYKFLREPGVDYATVLDAMLQAFARHHAFDTQQVFLFGFSGGAQFALRYGLISAQRLAGLVVAAPGNVTLIDDGLPWWAGTGGIEAATGRSLDRAGLSRLPIHLIVGALDRADGLVERGPDDPYYSPHANVAGADRRERLSALGKNLADAGIMVTEDIVADIGHDFLPIAKAAARHLAGVLG